jgi:hypothetical protein
MDAIEKLIILRRMLYESATYKVYRSRFTRGARGKQNAKRLHHVIANGLGIKSARLLQQRCSAWLHRRYPNEDCWRIGSFYIELERVPEQKIRDGARALGISDGDYTISDEKHCGVRVVTNPAVFERCRKEVDQLKVALESPMQICV